VKLKNRQVLIISIFILIILASGLTQFIYGEDIVIIPYNKNPSVVIDGKILPNEYDSNVSTDNGMTIYWTHDGKNLYVGLKSPGKGWLAIGFGSATMDGANIIIGYIDDSTGEVHIRDDTGIGHTHKPDIELGGENSILNYAGTQSDEGSVLEFSIPLNSGDKLDPPLLPGTTTNVIVAYHPSADDFETYHGSTYSIMTDVLIQGLGGLQAILNIKINGESVVNVNQSIDLVGSLLTQDGEPIPNAKIDVYTTTTFIEATPILLKTVKTDNTGKFDLKLNYNVPGKFVIFAKYEGGQNISSVESNKIQITVNGYENMTVHPEDPYYNWGYIIVNFPHMAHKTPFLDLSPPALAVLIPLYLIILGVWLTYLYVYRLIFKIKRGG